MQEAEVSRVRTLQGGWRWTLIVAAAATILLCVNQQFSLQFFLGYPAQYRIFLSADRIDAAVHLPDLSRIQQGDIDRIPWYDVPCSC